MSEGVEDVRWQRTEVQEQVSLSVCRSDQHVVQLVPIILGVIRVQIQEELG